MVKRLRALALPLIGLAATAVAQDEPATGAYLDGIVAIVNDGVVLQSELNSEADMIRQRLAAVRPAEVV